jgi:hypothetical protein
MGQTVGGQMGETSIVLLHRGVMVPLTHRLMQLALAIWVVRVRRPNNIV